MTEAHWTEGGVDDFVHRLSFDFITHLAKRLESGPLTRAQLAGRLGISKGRVSQILNNPSNLTLKKAITYARALGMKASLVAYDDHDPDNHNGPISSEIFTTCWEKAGKPADFQTAESIGSLAGTAITSDTMVLPERKGYVLTNRSAKSESQAAIVLDASVLIAIDEHMNAATNEGSERQLALAVGE